jgi:hypothetical protein
MRSVIWVICGGMITLGGAGAILSQDENETPSAIYQGTWINRKYKTTGPLRCTVREKEGNRWKARFNGTFKGDPFTYTVEFTAKKGEGKTDLKGKATLDGDQYEWTGQLKGVNFTVRYRSLKGYNGEFTLKESKSGR